MTGKTIYIKRRDSANIDYTGIELGVKTENTVKNGNGYIHIYPTDSYVYWKDYCTIMYEMKDIDGRFFFATLDFGNNVTTIYGDRLYVDQDGVIRNSADNDKKMGEVLFYIDEYYETSKIENKVIVDTEDSIVVNSRTAYKRLEGVVTVDEKEKILAPDSVEASVMERLL